MASEQQPSGLVDGKNRDRRQQQQIVSDGRPQPRYVRRDTHPRNLTAQPWVLTLHTREGEL
jgi:hypothetical protein